MPKAKKIPKSGKGGRRTKTQILFFSDRANSAISKARNAGKDTVSFEALTGKRVRSTDVKFIGGTGAKQVRGELPLSKISLPKSAANIQLSGRNSLDNVHKWHKGTAYDADNARPFRVKRLKNNQYVLHSGDAVRFAHYLSTGGDTNKISVTFNVDRITQRKIRALETKFREGKIKKSVYLKALDQFGNDQTIRTMVQEARGDRTLTPQRLGGTLGNRTGDVYRSTGFSRSKSTGVIRAGATTSKTRVYKQGRKSRKTAEAIARDSGNVIRASTEAGRVAQRRGKKS